MLMKTPLPAIISVLAASLLGAIGQFLFEYGARYCRSGITGFLANPYIHTGIAGYLLVMVLFTHAFSIGGTVRVLYPLYALTYIWAALIAWIVYYQVIQPIHVAGMILLIIGMVCMSW